MGISRAQTVHNASVAAGATEAITVSVKESQTMLVIWTITDSGASADIGATTVKPFTPSQTSARADQTPVVIETLIPATVVAAATRVGTVAAKADRYDVSGLEQVELKLTNAAASEKNVAVHVYLYG